jgi:fumarate reductase subunit C
MAREVTSIFIAGYTVLQLVGLARLAESRAAYETFLQALQDPASIVFHVLALIFAAYHSMTWFNLAPKAIPLQFGAARMPAWVMSGAHYVAWTIVSVGVLVCAGPM